ncbi:MAG: ABC transporter substrate-binding protein [Dehalococcoidia bacterium]|nr:ABC transporter substrate-binding protein [Dehalococcoidia bacterium]
MGRGALHPVGAAAAVMAALMFVGACASSSRSDPSGANSPSTATTIGLITPLTGVAAPYGSRQRIAVNLAVEEINSGGGVNGSQLRLVTVDDNADPREDAILVRRLAKEESAVAILGPLTGAGFEAVAPLASELMIPLATASSMMSGIGNENRPWTFRFSAQEALATPTTIRGYRKLYPNVKRMVIVGDTKDPVSEYNISNVYPKALKDAGLEVVGLVSFDTSTIDFTAVVTSLKGFSPDGIAFSSLTPAAVAISKELQRQGVRAPVLASVQNWAGPEVTLAGDTMEGWVAGGSFDEDTQDPIGRSYVARFVKAGEADPAVGKPAFSARWSSSYDAVTAIAEVLRGAKIGAGVDILQARTTVREGLQGLKGFKGVSGEMAVSSNGDFVISTLAFVAKKGKWVIIN